jgi:hypothetical protein
MKILADLFNKNRGILLGLAELTIILLWALWVGLIYLDMNPYNLPGRGNDDFILSIYPYYPLQRLAVCGDCALWNGLLNGGSPTLGDSIGGYLHPVMLALILVFGVHNGIKVAMVAAFIMAGWGQWWLGKVLKLGLPARLWMGLFAVVAGNLAGPNFAGDVGIVFSVAAASLVIAPSIQLAQSETRRDAITLALMIAQAILSGQGYLQVALAACVLPAFLVFVIDRKGLTQLWKRFAFAAILGTLLAAVAILPIFTIASQIASPGEPQSKQPLEYIPVNLIVREMEFFGQDVLGKIAAPNLYSNYIGWIPILLGIVAWRLVPARQIRIFYFFAAAIALSLLLSSGILLDWVRILLPNLLLGIRNPGFATGLTVSLIIGLSGWGLHLLLGQKWPEISFFQHGSDQKLFRLSTALILLPILFWSLRSVYEFNDQFRYLEPWPQKFVETAQAFPREETGWVRPPYGNWLMTAALVNQNTKVTNAYRVWDYTQRAAPDYQFDMTEDPFAATDPNQVAAFNDYFILRNPQSHYAYVGWGEERIPCQAQADGGHITVRCNAEKDGELVVLENALPGWNAWVDGQRVSLVPGQWLSVKLQRDQHEIRFRYLPLDFLLGAIISLASLAAAIWFWLSPEDGAIPPAAQAGVGENG